MVYWIETENCKSRQLMIRYSAHDPVRVIRKAVGEGLKTQAVRNRRTANQPCELPRVENRVHQEMNPLHTRHSATEDKFSSCTASSFPPLHEHLKPHRMKILRKGEKTETAVHHVTKKARLQVWLKEN